MDRPFSFFLIGKSLPYFFGGEAEDRSDEADQRSQDLIHRGLRASSQLGVSLFRIETVFQDIEIDRRKIDRAEIMDSMVHDMEFIVIIGFEDSLLDLFHAQQCPAVEFFHICVSDGVGLRIEVGQIAEQVAECISDLSVDVAHGLHDLVRQTDIALVVDRGDPESHDISAVFVDDILRSDDIADGLTHLSAFAVHGEAMGEDGLVWRMAIDSDRSQKRGVEPAAVLVRAFEIEIARIGHILPGLFMRVAEDAVPCGAGVEPYVHDVFFFMEMCAAAVRAFESFRQKFFCGMRPPCIGALFFDDLFDLLHGFRCDDPLAAVIAVESRDRNAPRALAGDAPVLTITDHVVETVMAPGWNETGVIDGFQCLVAEIIDGSEPLIGRSVDDRLLAAPTVRVLMVQGFLAEESAFMHEGRDHRAFRFPDGLADEEFAGFCRHVAFFIDRADDRLVELAGIFIGLVDFEVVDAVSRCGMNAAGAGIQRDMVAFQDIDGAVAVGFRSEMSQRVFEFRKVKFRAQHFTADKFIVFDFAVGKGCRSEILIHEIVFISSLVVYPDIGEFRIHADVAGSRDGPRGGGPDDGKDLARIYAFRLEAMDIDHRVFDIDGRRLSVLVFDLCFGQCRLAVGAPVNGLLALVDVALVRHFAENFQFLRFQMRIEGDIAMCEIADNAHTDEVFLLDLDPFLRVSETLLAEFQRGHVRAIFAGVLEYGVFDRQAMGIPARYIDGFIASHMVVSDDDILQCLIQRMTDVDLAVCIRRAIVQYEGRCAFLFSLFDSLFIQMILLPEFYEARFLFRKVAAHREFSFR